MYKVLKFDIYSGCRLETAAYIARRVEQTRAVREHTPPGVLGSCYRRVCSLEAATSGWAVAAGATSAERQEASTRFFR